MSEAVQRALDNLRFDKMVKSFCILSPEHEVFQSTLDSEVEAMVKQTIGVYKGKISQLTVNTDQGLVIISKIKDDWLLVVLFPANLSLGIAVVKTKATLLALRELELEIIRTTPPPKITPTPVTTPPSEPEEVPSPPAEHPSPPTPEADTQLPPPSIAQPAVTADSEITPPLSAIEPAPPPPPTSIPEPIPEAPAEAPPPPTLPPEKEGIGLSFIPRGGEELLSALDKGSPVGNSLFEKFGSYARDVLFLVDGKRDVKTIAFLLGLPEYAIVEVLEFAITQRILAPTAT